jgi:hypothetical protein
MMTMEWLTEWNGMGFAPIYQHLPLFCPYLPLFFREAQSHMFHGAGIFTNIYHQNEPVL